jgi:hypothetical protein
VKTTFLKFVLLLVRGGHTPFGCLGSSGIGESRTRADHQPRLLVVSAGKSEFSVGGTQSLVVLLQNRAEIGCARPTHCPDGAVRSGAAPSECLQLHQALATDDVQRTSCLDCYVAGVAGPRCLPFDVLTPM